MKVNDNYSIQKNDLWLIKQVLNIAITSPSGPILLIFLLVNRYGNSLYNFIENQNKKIRVGLFKVIRPGTGNI